MSQKQLKCEYSLNPYQVEKPDLTGKNYSFLSNTDMLLFHRSLEGYQPTPLISLPNLANEMNIGELYVKDESQRFDIQSFKALGASYAIYRTIKDLWNEKFCASDFAGIPSIDQDQDQCGCFNVDYFHDPDKMEELGKITFCAATDGNHGRAVAWTANRLGMKAVIYMPVNTAPARIEHIKEQNAKVVLIDGTFDDCVKQCDADAKKKGWQVIADTAYPGYETIPLYIMLGYSTLYHEMEENINLTTGPEIDVIILPAGVGGIAGAGCAYYASRYGAKRPKICIVEPSDSDCFLESLRYGNGKAIETRGIQHSIMVGLDCGIPSSVAWPIIKDNADAFISVTDDYAVAAMKKYHQYGIVSGESGSAGLAGLTAIMERDDFAEVHKALGLDKNSRVLLINTEGDTDPENYRRIVG